MGTEAGALRPMVPAVHLESHRLAHLEHCQLRHVGGPGPSSPGTRCPSLVRRKHKWQVLGPERHWVPPAETGTHVDERVRGWGRRQSEHDEPGVGQSPQTWPHPQPREDQWTGCWQESRPTGLGFTEPLRVTVTVDMSPQDASGFCHLVSAKEGTEAPGGFGPSQAQSQ